MNFLHDELQMTAYVLVSVMITIISMVCICSEKPSITIRVRKITINVRVMYIFTKPLHHGQVMTSVYTIQRPPMHNPRNLDS